MLAAVPHVASLPPVISPLMPLIMLKGDGLRTTLQKKMLSIEGRRYIIHCERDATMEKLLDFNQVLRTIYSFVGLNIL